MLNPQLSPPQSPRHVDNCLWLLRGPTGHTWGAQRPALFPGAAVPQGLSSGVPLLASPLQDPSSWALVSVLAGLLPFWWRVLEGGPRRRLSSRLWSCSDVLILPPHSRGAFTGGNSPWKVTFFQDVNYFITPNPCCFCAMPETVWPQVLGTCPASFSAGPCNSHTPPSPSSHGLPPHPLVSGKHVCAFIFSTLS